MIGLLDDSTLLWGQSSISVISKLWQVREVQSSYFAGLKDAQCCPLLQRQSGTLMVFTNVLDVKRLQRLKVHFGKPTEMSNVTTVDGGKTGSI